MRDVDNEGGCACVGAGGIWEISVPSAQFCCEPKTALKSKVYLKITKDINNLNSRNNKLDLMFNISLLQCIGIKCIVNNLRKHSFYLQREHFRMLTTYRIIKQTQQISKA